MEVDFLMVLNIVLGGILSVLSFCSLKKIPATAPWRWIKILHIGVGAIWSILYIGIAVRLLDNTVDPLGFSASIVRPMITFTLGILVSGSIITLRRFSCRRR